MAITKILHMKEGKGSKGKHLKQALLYIQNGEKTENGKYVSGINCQPGYAYSQMIQAKEQFNKTDKRQGYHIIISFEEGEITADKAFEFIGIFAREYLGKEYQAVYTVHTDTAHIHGHIVFNSVSFLTGKKFRYEKGDWAKYMQPLTNRLCEEYGLSTIKIEADKTQEAQINELDEELTLDTENKRNTYQNEWVNYKAGRYIWSDMIRRDVDACILLADSYEAFLTMLRDRGYELKQNKYLALKPPGMQRFRRCKSLGENYMEEMIRKRIVTETIDKKRFADNGELIPARVLWVKVPYHIKRAKLSGIQRQYFARLYRIGLLKKRPYSHAWKYRDDIRKMQKLHDRYMFLAEHEIHTVADIEAICDRLEKEQEKADLQKRTFYKEKNRFKELFAIVSEMDNLLPGYQSYAEGDKFFEEEYSEYSRLELGLSKQGYTYEQLKDIQKHYRERGKSIWNDMGKLRRELAAAKGILDEIRSEGQAIKLDYHRDELMQITEVAAVQIEEMEKAETIHEIKKEADENAHDFIRR